jgi:hypothetical protein
VNVAQKHAGDLAQPRIVWPAHGDAGIVENARAVGILEDHGAVKKAEFTILSAERCDLHIGRQSRVHGQTHQSNRRHDE